MLAACLIAAFAIAAVAASGASALEWAKCEAKAGGNYTESNCKTKAKPKGTGSFELLKAKQVSEKRVAEGKSANVPFSGESVGGGGLLASSARECAIEGETQLVRVTRQKCAEDGGVEQDKAASGNLYVECAKENNTGEAEGTNKITNVHVLFTGCAAFGNVPCESAGKASGEIETNPLRGALGYINKAKKEVGVVLEPAKKKGHFAEFNCSGFLEIVVGVGNNKEGAEYADSCHGVDHPDFGAQECKALPTEEKHGGYDQIISPITPVNQMTSEFTQVYKVQRVLGSGENENIPNHLEGKHLSLLENYQLPEGINGIPGSSSDWTAASEEITNVNTPEE